MKSTIFFLCLLAVILGRKLECLTDVTAEKYFEQVESSDRPWLVKFYADWCPHCRNLQPTWNQIAEELCEDETLSIGQINIDQQRPLANQFRIRSIPTVMVIKGNQMYMYNGGRTKEDLISFLKGAYATHGAKPVPPKP